MPAKRFVALMILGAALFGATAAQVSAQEACTWLADRHIARGINCDTCHDANLKLKTIGEMQICVSCHGDFQQMAIKTQGRYAVNPHAPHEAGLACTSCHKAHKQSENHCAQCHKFDFKVP